jgi:hypothetical protein
MKAYNPVLIFSTLVLVFMLSGFAPAQSLTGLPGVLQWTGQSAPIGHLIGQPGSGTTWFVNEPGSQNWLSYGPYTTISTPGDYVAIWSLSATLPFGQNVDPSNPALANTDVNDATTQTEIATRQPRQGEFPGFGSVSPGFATLMLPFSIDSTRAGHQFEFRVFWFANSNMTEQVLGFVRLQWNAQNPALGHVIGRPDGTGWSASTFDGQQWMQYGPYTTLSTPGNYVALWTLQVDNNTTDNNAVAIVDINDATTQTRLQSLQILRKQFNAAHVDQSFQLPFSIDSSRAGHQFEFRIWYTAVSYVREQAVGVVQTP